MIMAMEEIEEIKLNEKAYTFKQVTKLNSTNLSFNPH